MNPELELPDIKLNETCGACPEAYDVYFDGEYVGYLRLRHGYFAAYFGNSRESVYSNAHTIGDGIFDSSERDREINRALNALLRAWAEAKNAPVEPLIPYRVTHEPSDM